MNRSVFSPKFSLVEYYSRNRLHLIPTNGQRGKHTVQSLEEMHHREVIAKDILQYIGQYYGSITINTNVRTSTLHPPAGQINCLHLYTLCNIHIYIFQSVPTCSKV
jgi:hypothetical protein